MSVADLAATVMLAVFLTLGPPALAAAQNERTPRADELWVYVGTYTGDKPGDSRGIYRCVFDAASGKLSEPVLAGEIGSPSFLAIHPNRGFLYCVGETADFGGAESGSVNAFAIDAKTGDLKLLNRQPSGGGGPCHIVVDKAGKNVLVANYGGGSCAALPIGADGRLMKPSCVIQHHGSSVDKQRQEGPHAHSINLDAANRFAVCADLGLDKVFVYKFDSADGTLTANDPPAYESEPGSGPRHFAFHPNGKFAYVNNEMASSVTALQYDADKGVLKKIQTLSTLPRAQEGNSTAETVVSPSGKFLYVSNRGHNSIAIFSIDQATGELTAVGHQGAGINVPRNFNIDPSGKWLIVANQDGNSLSVFAIDDKTGKLNPTPNTVKLPRPVCVRFLTKPVDR